MSNLHHVYLTCHGSYPTGSWVGESAQIGMRLAFAVTATAPLMGEIWTPVEGGNIDTISGTQAGTHGTLAKTWTARVGAVLSDENLDPAAQIDLAEDAWTFLNTIKQYQFSEFKWTHVKVSAVDTLGKTPVVSSIYQFNTPLPGSLGNGLPPQVAMAVSTRANLVGRRGRGRVYIPALTTAALAADGTIATATATGLRTAFKTFIDALQNQPGITLHMPIVSVMSAESNTAVRPAEIRTGSRLDTIQSRRRQVAEAYATTAL